MKKIRISSTSYLFPKETSWNILKKKFSTSFSEIGSLFDFKKDKKFDHEVIIFFLPDILEYDNLDKNNFSENKKKIEIFIKKFEAYLKKSANNVIFAYSEFLFYNQIKFSRNIKYSSEIKNYLSKKINELILDHKNIYQIDLDFLFGNYGFKKIYSDRNFYLMNCRLSSFGIRVLSKNLLKFLEKIDISSKKLLILDCDNTLWGGVIGEDGISKIQIGQDGIGKAFTDFQKVIKNLKKQGILLAIASKNNLSDVKKVFKKNKNMVLKEEDITIFKVNWNDKAKNILEISKDLMLGLDSFVFWDDNPIERKKIKRKLKKVKVIEPDSDVSEWPRQLLEFDEFTKFSNSKDDKNKTEQYKKRSKFIENKKLINDEIKYLKSIRIKPQILKLNSSNIDRAVQMTLKTNQFNFSTKRYNHKGLQKIKKENEIFLIKLNDLYGDHGIVALVILKLKKNVVLVDTFLISCRILGRYLEDWILKKIQEFSKKNQARHTIIDFRKNEKNNVAQEFIKRLNLKIKNNKIILENNHSIEMSKIYD